MSERAAAARNSPCCWRRPAARLVNSGPGGQLPEQSRSAHRRRSQSWPRTTFHSGVCSADGAVASSRGTRAGICIRTLPTGSAEGAASPLSFLLIGGRALRSGVAVTVSFRFIGSSFLCPVRALMSRPQGGTRQTTRGGRCPERGKERLRGYGAARTDCCAGRRTRHSPTNSSCRPVQAPTACLFSPQERRKGGLRWRATSPGSPQSQHRTQTEPSRACKR